MMAASTRPYNAANMMLMRTESTPADTLVAMLASCGATGMQAPRSIAGLDDAMGGGQKRSFYPMFDTSEETGDEDAADDCNHHVEKKRRLTVDQVRSLEKNFELENKLEPERKMQLARELGLQPRQVAVWFQNRRARWKTKQLERDYDMLKLDYDALKSDYDSIVEDKEKLQAEILRLTKKFQAEPKQSELEAQVFEADELDLSTGLGQHLEMTLTKCDSGVQVAQDYQQLSIAGMNQGSPVKSKGGQTGGSTSSESNSSEIMNADSPHPIDSDVSPGVDQTTFMCNQLSSSTDPINVDTTLVQLAEELCGGRLVTPQPFHQRVAVKLEDGVSSNVLQEECGSYFYTMDESGNLPWWEWP